MSEFLFLVVFLVALIVFGVQYMVGSSKAAKIASSNSLRKSAAGAGIVRYDYASLFGGAMLAALLIIVGLIFKVDVKPWCSRGIVDVRSFFTLGCVCAFRRSIL